MTDPQNLKRTLAAILDKPEEQLVDDAISR